jgi:hypothetical protein
MPLTSTPQREPPHLAPSVTPMADLLNDLDLSSEDEEDLVELNAKLLRDQEQFAILFKDLSRKQEALATGSTSSGKKRRNRDHELPDDSDDNDSDALARETNRKKKKKKNKVQKGSGQSGMPLRKLSQTEEQELLKRDPNNASEALDQALLIMKRSGAKRLKEEDSTHGYAAYVELFVRLGVLQ